MVPSPSSLVWAQLTDDPNAYAYNDSSWNGARNQYYRALRTGKDSDWVQTFQKIGQLMHLVSDASVPAHVRNDSHPLKDPYEVWAKDREVSGLFSYEPIEVDPTIFRQAASNLLANVPISALWDQDHYDGSNPTEAHLGLAEYTNANFFSRDTIFTSPYPHPNVSDTNIASIDWANPDQVEGIDASVENKIYIRHNGADNFRVLAAGYFLWDCTVTYETNCWDRTWLLDDTVYEDYAAMLIPRAMGYSAALLDYFFRGTIEVKQAQLKRHALGGITGLSLEIRNASLLGQEPELMTGGGIDVVCRYRPAGSSVQESRCATNAYIVSGESDPINADFVSVVATFPASIPAGATDLTLTVIYRGGLGREDDAVAAKVIPLSSRIAFSLQSDPPYGPSLLYTAQPNGSDPRRIDSPPGYPWNAFPSWAAQGALLAYNGITYGGHYDILVVDPLSDLNFPDNLTARLNDPKAHYICPSFSPDGAKIVAHRMLLDPPMDGSDPANALVVFDLPTGTCSFLGGVDLWLSMTSAEQPKWSPSGTKIVFQLLKKFQGWDAIYNIWSINRDGSNPQGLLNEDFDSRGPAWSPDGKQIVFGSRRDGGENLDIWIMDSNGANPRMLLDCGPSDCVHYAFSPDGASIVFQITGEALYTMRLDGTELTPLATNGVAATPTWSPYLFEPPQSP